MLWASAGKMSEKFQKKNFQLGFTHARVTIPKWFQRGMLDKLDSTHANLAKQIIQLRFKNKKDNDWKKPYSTKNCLFLLIYLYQFTHHIHIRFSFLQGLAKSPKTWRIFSQFTRALFSQMKSEKKGTYNRMKRFQVHSFREGWQLCF